ncbi:MAG: DUF802 domain-containing protein [Pseudomonadota bacterium]
MNRIVFIAAFAIGLLTVGWIGFGFIGSSGLALLMTALIGAVFVLGAQELRRYRTATGSLAGAVANAVEPGTDKDAWLERVPAALRNATRLRIEGERIALPGLTLTPYLVGLLVMLGMLGTFLGMVLTFKGVVFALEGSTDLQAIRSALAAPVKGLGLAFGTSVAGVATSALLGLMSAMCRRERVEVARQLDTLAATVFRPFSLAHQRQEAFKALQVQAHALPAVVDRLQAMMDGLERRSEQLNAQLLGQQEHFHRGVTGAYTDLAKSVSVSLSDSLAAGAKAAGESIKPVVEAAMSTMATESRMMHQRVFDATQAQLNGLTGELAATIRSAGDGWNTALQNNARTSEKQLDHLGRTLAGFAVTFEERSAALVATVHETASASLSHQQVSDAQRQHAWMEALENMAATARTFNAELAGALQTHVRHSESQVERLGIALTGFADTFEQRSAGLIVTVQEAATASQSSQATAEQQRLKNWTKTLEDMATALQVEWQRVGTQTLAEQHAATFTLAQTAGEITERASQQAGKTLSDIAGVLAQSEALVRSRIDTEAQWTQQQGDRMDQLATLWRTELRALRADEATRGEAAVERLGELQAALAGHLATLGAALEAPMTRLMQTAAEVPQAAAEVITQLRQEMTRLSERDNLAFEERSSLLEKISSLLQSLNHASGEQRAAIESLVASATSVLERAANQFSVTLDGQAGKTEEVAAHVVASAVEMASLGESFNHGVQLFSASNDKLIDSLQRMESTIGQSVARSDEQLAYYVAQAREVIDLSITSQQGLVEDLRRRDTTKTMAAKVSAE